MALGDVGKLLLIAGAVILRDRRGARAARPGSASPSCPGSISVSNGSFSFFFPVAFCIVVSVVLTVVINLIVRLRQ